MALIECRECGKRVSTNAESCPNCGNPTKKSGSTTGSLFGGFIIGCIAVIALLLYMATKTAERVTDLDEKTNTSYSQEKEPRKSKSQDVGQASAAPKASPNEDKMGDWVYESKPRFKTLEIESANKIKSPDGEAVGATLKLSSNAIYLDVRVKGLKFDCDRRCTVKLTYNDQRVVRYQAFTSLSKKYRYYLEIKSVGTVEEILSDTDSLKITLNIDGLGETEFNFNIGNIDAEDLLYVKPEDSGNIKRESTYVGNWDYLNFHNSENSGVNAKILSISSNNLVPVVFDGDVYRYPATLKASNNSLLGNEVIVSVFGAEPVCETLPCFVLASFDGGPANEYPVRKVIDRNQSWIEFQDIDAVKRKISNSEKVIITARYYELGDIAMSFDTGRVNLIEMLNGDPEFIRY